MSPCSEVFPVEDLLDVPLIGRASFHAVPFNSMIWSAIWDYEEVGLDEL